MVQFGLAGHEEPMMRERVNTIGKVEDFSVLRVQNASIARRVSSGDQTPLRGNGRKKANALGVVIDTSFTDSLRPG